MLARWVVTIVVALAAACGSGPRVGPTDRPWTIADFHQVAGTSSCGRLPSFGSPAFTRMTAPSVPDDLDPPDNPVHVRIPALLDYFETMNAIFKHYVTGCGDVPAALAIMASILEGAVRIAPLMDAMLETFSPDDPTYATRMDGLAQFKQGLVTMATGAALMVRSTNFAAPVPGVGRRLGAALARLKRRLPDGALDSALGNLDVPEGDDDNVHRRALRADIRTGLHSLEAP
jgi:hypothetical protein